jgi:bifunctional UDP-N-acetylglucosamine pyrophosphorylase/glucosamine-1-phosphate N-acetyltransferase
LFNDPHVMLGVNDRWQLAEASAILRKRVLRELALSGVTIIDPENTYVGVDVRVGQDTILEPMTILEGTTTIGSNCKIGPAARIVDSTIGNGCTVNASQVHRATLLDGVRCGPYANLRPGALVGVQAKIGNFVELKNASLGTKASVSHLSYIGDGSVGDGANIGAGTIFCNYDGIDKHRTEVGDGAFVGSNTTLVAPVKIGEGAIVAAGSVITSDVPENALALGRSRQEVKEAWASKWRDKKKKDA